MITKDKEVNVIWMKGSTDHAQLSSYDLSDTIAQPANNNALQAYHKKIHFVFNVSLYNTKHLAITVLKHVFVKLKIDKIV